MEHPAKITLLLDLLRWYWSQPANTDLTIGQLLAKLGDNDIVHTVPNEELIDKLLQLRCAQLVSKREVQILPGQ